MHAHITKCTITDVIINALKMSTMKQLFMLVLLYRFLPVFSISCVENPSQLQCLAANNRFIMPRKSNCDPFKKDCRMGDLIKPTIAGL